MAAAQYFVVQQEREVKVLASSAADAARIADAAFNNGQNSDSGVINGPEGVWGNTRSMIKTTSLYVRED